MTHKHFSALRCIIDQIDVHRVVSDYDPVGNWKNPSNIPIIFSPSLSKKLIHAHISKPSLNSTPDTRKNPDRRRFRPPADNTPSHIQVVYKGFIFANIWNGVSACAIYDADPKVIATRVTSAKVNIVAFQHGFDLEAFSSPSRLAGQGLNLL
jgi:hypothetical protein